MFVLPANVVVEERRHPRHAGFHQPPREQTRLPAAIPAVAVADLLRLAVQVERLAHGRRVQQPERRRGTRGVRGRDGRAVEFPQQFAPPTRQVRRAGEAAHEVRGVQWIGHDERVAGAAEEAGGVAGAGQFGQQDRAVDVNRRVREAVARPHPMHHRAEGREVVPRSGGVRRLARVELAGEREVARRPVVQVVVRHRPHDGEPIRQFRYFGQVFGEPHAGHGRGDGAERAADFGRRVRLRVPRFQLALPAGREHDQHGFGAGDGARRRPRAAGEQRGRAEREPVPAGRQHSERRESSGEREHERECNAGAGAAEAPDHRRGRPRAVGCRRSGGGAPTWLSADR